MVQGALSLMLSFHQITFYSCNMSTSDLLHLRTEGIHFGQITSAHVTIIM